MKYLCQAYGKEEDWNELGKAEQDELLAQDEVMRQRGDLVAAVEPTVTTVRSWDGPPKTESRSFADLPAPLAGFGVIEAESLEEAILLVARTPCAKAKGAVELRPIGMAGNLPYIWPKEDKVEPKP
jgi:hypothetical protein